MSALTKIGQRFRNVLAKTVGTYAPSIPSSWPVNWFQQGYPVSPNWAGGNSAVEACVAAYAQTIAQCPINHYRHEEDGSYTIIRDSNIAAILDKPNDFQTRSDFMNNLVYSILYEGNGYWFAPNDPRETDRIYLLHPKSTQPEMTHTGDIFYSTGGQFTEIAGINQAVNIPSRFVGHVRLYTPNNPILGVSPIQAASASVAANNAITVHQAAFFENMRRPSGVLTTEMKLNKDQINMLREAWDEQSQKLNAGGVPILSNGLSWEALSITSQDAQLVEAWRMSVEDISRVFRIPKVIINSMENSTFSNVEQLMSFWLSSGLGFMVDAIEQTFKSYFRLPPNESVECDTDVLLRADLEGRVNAYGAAVTKGLMAPNEARRIFRLPPVQGGDEPRVQQQMVPLSWEHPEAETFADPAGEEPDDEPTVEDDVIEEAFLPTALKVQFNESRKASKYSKYHAKPSIKNLNVRHERVNDIVNDRTYRKKGLIS